MRQDSLFPRLNKCVYHTYRHTPIYIYLQTNNEKIKAERKDYNPAVLSLSWSVWIVSVRLNIYQVDSDDVVVRLNTENKKEILGKDEK